MLITSDHNYGLSTMLRHIAAAVMHVHIFVSLCSGFSAEKNGAKKNPPRIPVTFRDFPFSSETPYLLTVVAGSTSRYGLLFFVHSVLRKKKSEPVTCA